MYLVGDPVLAGALELRIDGHETLPCPQVILGLGIGYCNGKHQRIAPI